MPLSELQTKNELFGSIRKVRAMGGHRPNLKYLKEVVRETKTVMPLFCEGCGYSLGLTAEVANRLAEKTNTALPAILTDNFLTVKHCKLCDDDFKEMRLEKLR